MPAFARRHAVAGHSGSRRTAAAWCAVGAVTAALPPPVAHATLAAVAGTLFEAAPILVIAVVAPGRLGRWVALGGCGCGRGELPGALAPAAVALCWLAFGPALALLRAGAAAALALRRGHHGTPAHGAPPEDPFRDLGALAVAAAGASLAASIVTRLVPDGPARLLAGLALGALAPCATAGVALAAGLAGPAPLVAAGILATAGIAPPLRLRFGGAPGARADARFAFALLALALAALFVRGPSGFVSPRLVPLAGAGALAALVACRRRRDAFAGAAALPALMLAALIAGSPPPADGVATSPAGAYPGAAAGFTGTVRPPLGPGYGTRLVRFSIACCRLDATAESLELARDVHVPAGAWISARGRFVERHGRLVLNAERWRRIATPADPFSYR